MPNHKPKILSQGAFDAACLLYAIMNAYKSFKSKSMSSNYFAVEEKEVWNKLVKLVSSPLNMFNGKGSSYCFNNNEVEATFNFVRKAIKLFDQSNSYSIRKISIDDLLNLYFADSVVIICYTEDGEISSPLNNTIISDHWVCAIGCEDRSICVQCSFTSQLSSSYKEKKERTTGRYFNQKISVKQLNPSKIAEDYIYLIFV